MSARLSTAALALCFPIILGGCQLLSPIADDADSGAFDPRTVMAASFLIGGGLLLKSSGSEPSAFPTIIGGDDDGGSDDTIAPITPPGPPPLPMPLNGVLLSALNAYATPTALAADAIRAGLDMNTAGGGSPMVPITGLRYDDAAGDPQVFVQQSEFAAFGYWVAGNAPVINEFDHDYDYAFLDNGNIVAPPSTADNRGTATYDVEGDATYKGAHFFPDNFFTANFNAGTVTGGLSASSNNFHRADDFGDANALVPNDMGVGVAPSTADPNGDLIDVSFTATIDADGFRASTITVNSALGFFSDLTGVTSGSVDGRFYDDPAAYDPAVAAPTNLAGIIEVINGGGMDDLKMGFIGKRRP